MESRKELINRYRELRELVSRVLAEWDPYCLTSEGGPVDEFEMEVSQLLPLLRDARSPYETANAISVVFSAAFEAQHFTPENCAVVANRLYSELVSHGFAAKGQ